MSGINYSDVEATTPMSWSDLRGNQVNKNCYQGKRIWLALVTSLLDQQVD
jgi:hypothetical protein